MVAAHVGVGSEDHVCYGASILRRVPLADLAGVAPLIVDFGCFLCLTLRLQRVSSAWRQLFLESKTRGRRTKRNSHASFDGPIHVA